MTTVNIEPIERILSIRPCGRSALESGDTGQEISEL
jgi:hypothetical protein